jgi:uncharacterized membrane protein YeiH
VTQRRNNSLPPGPDSAWPRLRTVALAAGGAGRDLLGIIVLATLTAIGDGTPRDILFNRHPIFWIADAIFPILIVAIALATVFWVRFSPVPAHALPIADANL